MSLPAEASGESKAKDHPPGRCGVVPVGFLVRTGDRWRLWKLVDIATDSCASFAPFGSRPVCPETPASARTFDMQAMHTRFLASVSFQFRFVKQSFTMLSLHWPHFFGTGRLFFGMVQPFLGCWLYWPDTSAPDERWCTHGAAPAQHALSSENGRDFPSLTSAAVHRATASHSRATRHPQTQRGHRLVPALPPPRATPGRACSHRRHPPTSNLSVFSPTQRLSAPSYRPRAPHPRSWHLWVLEHEGARPHRGRAPSARRLGPTQGHAPCPQPPETRAAGRTWYLQRRERALRARGAQTALKMQAAAHMKPPS